MDMHMHTQPHTHTFTYIRQDEPNNLYMLTYVEDEGNKSTYGYCADYHLRYTLTDQEIAEYKMLYGSRYCQACFMNDAISEQKNVEILSKAYMRTSAHEGFAKALASHDDVTGKSFINSENLGVLMQDFDASSRTCNLIVFSTSRDVLNSSHSGKMAIVPLETAFMQESNGVYLASYYTSNIRVNSNKMAEYQDSVENVTIFDTTYAHSFINDLLDKE